MLERSAKWGEGAGSQVQTKSLLVPKFPVPPHIYLWSLGFQTGLPPVLIHLCSGLGQAAR